MLAVGEEPIGEKPTVHSKLRCARNWRNCFCSAMYKRSFATCVARLYYHWFRGFTPTANICNRFRGNLQLRCSELWTFLITPFYSCVEFIKTQNCYCK